MIVCRSPIEIEKLRRVNQLVARILAELRPMVAPGVTTKEIDGSAEALVRKAGAEPAFKGYHGYPATVCVSINEQVVHGIPSARRLVEGDVLSLDMGAKLDGFFGDCAVTLPVGRVSPETGSLLRVTEEALFHGIDVVRPGARVSDIGAAVQQHVEAPYANSSVMGSVLRCTRSRRSPITGRAGAGPGCRREWFSRSSRWSTRAPRR
jgi:methionyl aminopeptidase